MFKKGTIPYSVTKGKCPKCHEGDFFAHTFSFHPSKALKLNENCSHCNLKYMIEPSFFYGAMYINYAITVALSVAVFIISKVFIGTTLLQSFGAIVVSLLVLAPLNLRFSRILWIHMFVSYEENTQANTTSEK